MSLYISFIVYAIPVFVLLIFIELIISMKLGIKVNNAEDMISSLSSGITDTIRSGLKWSIAIISYDWLVNNFTLYKLESIWISVIIAVIIQDFTGYWIHRLKHRVNIFWNEHIIHHSSEEFNLSCALRQSISEVIRFNAIFMIPAALLGVPTKIFAIIGPIHLFMQFWYHTRLINKMGFLEHIIVTPSHHRVHHAINQEYIDKNYSQIFIIWDKIFGTFQEELDTVKPVYGILRPVNTWNPILINFQHLWQLIKDAWYSENFVDKLRIWFMPTGWRSKDVSINYPIAYIKDPYHQNKYKKYNSNSILAWSFIQLNIALVLMFHMFISIQNYDLLGYVLYPSFLFIHIFAFTALLDHSRYALLAESIKILLALNLIGIQKMNWYGIDGIILYIFIFYLVLSLTITYFYSIQQNNNQTIIKNA